MLQDNEEDGKELLKTVTKDNDGHESVAEYYAKKKAEREDSKSQPTEQKESEENEDAKALQVVSAIPHFATFALGAGAGGGLKWLIDKMREGNGKK